MRHSINVTDTILEFTSVNVLKFNVTEIVPFLKPYRIANKLLLCNIIILERTFKKLLSYLLSITASLILCIICYKYIQFCLRAEHNAELGTTLRNRGAA